MANNKPTRKKKATKPSKHAVRFGKEKSDCYATLAEQEKAVNGVSAILRQAQPSEEFLATLDEETKTKLALNYNVTATKLNQFDALRAETAKTLSELELPKKRDAGAEFQFRTTLNIINQKLLAATTELVIPITVAAEEITELLATAKQQPTE